MGKTKMMNELKNVPATRRSANPALTPRAQTLLGYLTYGIEEPDPDHPDIPAGRPLGPYQAAAILGVRRTYVRTTIANPVFKVEIARAAADARAALQPKAVATLGALLDWEGSGSSADANVRATAAKTILGDDTRAPSVNVNVQTNVDQAIRPGYVIRLPPDLERRSSETKHQKP
jgi:hypothetical protein